MTAPAFDSRSEGRERLKELLDAAESGRPRSYAEARQDHLLDAPNHRDSRALVLLDSSSEESSRTTN